MDLAERISTLRRANGLSARQLAALVGVAPTTITRIEAGAVSPSFDLAEEIFAVLGEPIGFSGVADVAAIAAARLALDPSLDIAVSPAVTAWWRRWARIGLVDDAGRVAPDRAADLLLRAGRVARLTRRPGAVDFEPGLTADDLAEALAGAGIEYALTGDAGANRHLSTAGETWPVVYVQDVDRAAEEAALVRRQPGSYGLRVTLIPFDGVSEVDRIDIRGILVAARDQVILDAYGGIDRMAEQADILTGQRIA